MKFGDRSPGGGSGLPGSCESSPFAATPASSAASG